jgi:cell division septum initiation protein DivIVA
MAQTPLLENIFERVDRLLVRHEELKRTNILLEEQVAQLLQERDSMKTRLQTAKTRVESLLDRLPAEVLSKEPK